MNKYLPTSAKEMKLLSWETPDVVLFTGDAYIDHPAFGISVIARILENEGLKVAIVAQPNWKDDLRDFKKFGRPRLFFGVSAGNMDSMVNHYTANKRLRSNDAYTPGNKSGFRPDYASIVYSNILKKLFPDVPVILGGIEASLRRLTHYDYISDNLKPGILIDSKADMLVYGMGEKTICEISRQLLEGKIIKEIQNIPQTSFFTADKTYSENNYGWESLKLHSFEVCLKSKKKFAENFKHIEEESNKLKSARLIQPHANGFIIVNPPQNLLTEKELDSYYKLPFTRLPHPRYASKGNIPAYEMIKYSVNIHRGCFGACSFCTISAHQGKFITSRSEESVLTELKKIIDMPGFKGYISDLGGPSANMYKMEPENKKICEKCKRPSCSFPEICNNLNTDHKSLTGLYRKSRDLKGIKKIFIGSGVRYDLFLQKNKNKQINKNNSEYCSELIKHHVSGRLKVAPEHSSFEVLKTMRKPPFKQYYELNRIFENINSNNNLKQQLIPYFISSHPGCKNSDMAELAVISKKLSIRPEQVQDFTPTPMTLATVMYYTGIDPYTGKDIHTARTKEEKLSQRKFFFWYEKEYRNKIINELKHTGRQDIIKKLFN
ncbi:YgiQ family radical SAM protein [Bacteroidota bacterium]